MMASERILLPKVILQATQYPVTCGILMMNRPVSPVERSLTRSLLNPICVCFCYIEMSFHPAAGQHPKLQSDRFSLTSHEKKKNSFHLVKHVFPTSKHRIHIFSCTGKKHSTDARTRCWERDRSAALTGMQSVGKVGLRAISAQNIANKAENRSPTYFFSH